MALLEVKNIYKSFGGVKAIQDFSLAADAGQIHGIIGPNGAGKTTIFNVISGVYPADQGSVTLNGQDITKIEQYKITRLGMGRTFQNIRLFKGLTVEENVTGAIRQGLVVLLGVEDGDTEKDADYIAEKVAGLRIFDDADGVMNRSVLDIGGGVLSISQFTLLGDVRKGKRPSYSHAARPEEAKALYAYFNQKLTDKGIPVGEGIFQAEMLVRIYNDGPVTILLDSHKLF